MIVGSLLMWFLRAGCSRQRRSGRVNFCFTRCGRGSYVDIGSSSSLPCANRRATAPGPRRIREFAIMPSGIREFAIIPSGITIRVAIELSVSTWLVAARLPGVEKSRLYRLEGGDAAARHRQLVVDGIAEGAMG